MTTLDNSGIQVTLRTRQGSDFSCLVRVKDAVTGAPFDLTGYTGMLRIFTDSETVEIPCTITGNELAFTIGHATTAVLPPQSSHELFITSPADKITFLFWGSCLVIQQVRTA
jgi:hypothetical protein